MFFFNKQKSEQKRNFKDQLKLANSGNADAQYCVGQSYLNGTGVAKSEKDAVAYFKLSADQSNTDGLYAYGRCLYKGIGTAKDGEAAAKCFKAAADAGHADAMAEMGYFQLYGSNGVQKDMVKGIQLMQEAYAHGSMRGAMHLASCYDAGWGVPKDESKAAQYYLEAAQNGETEAYYMIACRYESGRGIEQNLQKAAEYFKKGAESGDALAQFGYANLLEKGLLGKTDYSEVEKWYKKAADCGNANAMACLGSLYERELAISFNSDKSAFNLYQQASKMGNARAFDFLGSYYERHVNLPNYQTEAARCYKAAADKGYPDGLAHYGHCLRIGFGVPQNMALAKDYLQKAMDKKSAEAYCEWGNMLEWGVNTSNPSKRATAEEAFSYYKKAADMGNARGQCEVARCYNPGIGCASNLAESKRYAKLAREQGNAGGLYWMDISGNLKKAAQKGYPLAESKYYNELVYNARNATNPSIREKYAQEALEYLKSAAAHGSELAMSQFAGTGNTETRQMLGIKVDLKTALEYAQRIVRYGYMQGYYYLAMLYDSEVGRNGINDDKKAFENYKLYAEAGGREHVLELGKMYLYGRGTAQNYANAYKCFKYVYDNNLAKVIIGYWLGLCYENGYGVQRDLAQAVKYYRQVEQDDGFFKEEALARQALKRLGR